MKYFLWIFILSIVGLAVYFEKFTSKTNDEPSPAQSPQEQLADFVISDGLMIQLVASEPMVQDPVVITFDEDGRLWVVEMRGFMPDIEGNGENEPVGRVSILEDTDGDGKMDNSTIYLDSLIMPRALAVIKGGALVVENMSLWLTQDVDGDLKADTKTLIDPDYAGNNLPEHSGNGLWKGMDNWYYNAKSKFRYKKINGQWKRDETEGRGQWGISHDDYGRLVYNYNWSQLHADLVPPNYLGRNPYHKPTTGIDHGLTVDRRIYPIRPNPAVNRGYISGTLDEQGKLMEFTSACAPLVYRGKALPDPFYGNVFVCEPSGNLIKRNKVRAEGLYLKAEDPQPGKEFLASTDERFRPVHLASGPDGALYVADMYRGLVQHGAYISPYLKEQTLSRNLVQPINKGRIWRIVPEGWKPSKTKRLSDLSVEALVELLAHEDGWYRDVAQRLLTERKDPSALVLLNQMARTGPHPSAKIHALWTLEGLDQLDEGLLFEVLEDHNPQVSSHALRILEPLASKSSRIKKTLENRMREDWPDAPVNLVLQMALSTSALGQEARHEILLSIAEKFSSEPIIRDAVLSSLGDESFTFLEKSIQSRIWNQKSASNEVFIEMLSSAIVKRGQPEELRGLLAIIDSVDGPLTWQNRALFAGITNHARQVRTPTTLTNPPGLLKKQEDLREDQISALALVYDWPGLDRKAWASPNQTDLTDEEQNQFVLGRQFYLSTCSGCHGNQGEGANRLGPPLAQSEWVTGNEKQLSLIILHGMEGPISVNGKKYDQPEILPVMPAHSSLDDATIAAIMTYIRNEWGNDGGPVSRRAIGLNRNTLQGRVYPWKAEELRQYILEDTDQLSAN